MIIYELVGTEDHEVYQQLQVSNTQRQYFFLQSIIEASLKLGRPFLSSTVLKSLNFHAITCLHTNAGEYRPCPVKVGGYRPPAHHSVQALMDDLVNEVNYRWEQVDTVPLAAYVLWRLNQIHPFINGNGRTARAACYFVVCVKSRGFIPGVRILPELLRENRDRYVQCLQAADGAIEGEEQTIQPLVDLIYELLDQQMESAKVDP